MASVVGVLFYEQDKPLNKWGLGQTYLSPNVVVSFLGTLGKSACLVVVAESVSQLKWLHFHKRSQELNDLQLFDAASRGPWGALQLVFRKHGSAFLAKCASVVILASLLIDPFIQSVFQFPSILTPVEGVYPTILSSHIYDPSSLDYRYDQCYGAAMVSAPMQAAILAPIWNATRNPSLPCKFERCEWPTITTLGVCSECIDLTDTVVPTCTENPHVIQKYIDCNYTLPRSINTFNVVFGVSGGASVSEPYSTIWNSAMEDAPIDLMRDAYSKIESGFVSSQPAQIVNFTFVQLDPVDVKHSPLNLTSPEPLKKAMQCTIHFCARTFETPYYSNFTASPLAGKSVGLVTAAEGTTTGNKAKILLGLGPENKTAVSTNTSFQINYCDYQDLTLYLQDLFSAEMDIRATPNTGLALSQVDDIPALLQQIADSMTEQIRVSANSTTTNGVAMQSEVFIAIKWAWLVLPISVTVLTFLLLIYVIVLNKARGMPPWRSSSLALLFHQVDGWEGTETVLGGPEDMKARAKEMKARVTYEDGMLYFSKES
ncbi:hypothetical protein BJ166DRAFT_626873 [Pestalotiopsis sp. NC0098]|nr:hypothetical protein BJ166DRAFT_626873 [Pestalotiopsis sp. NC0098]